MSSQKRTQWDAAQFFGTLTFFGEIPFLGSFRWLQEWLGQRITFSGINLSVMKDRLIVIGELPEGAFETLKQRLPAVDISLYSEATVLSLSDAEDADIGETSRQEILRQLASADDWVVAEVSDFSCLVNKLADVSKAYAAKLCRMVFDFTKEGADFAAWGSLDDVVMGGVSQSQLIRTTEAGPTGQGSGCLALFAGVVSTENSGGFSSVRTQNFEPPFNLAGYAGIRLRVRGDGQRYKFILRNSGGWDSPAYIYSFDTQSDVWLMVDVPFAEMVPTFRARSVPDAAPFDPSKIFSFQLMLSKFEYDRQLNPKFSPGQFSMAIATMSAYRDRQDAALVVLGSVDEGKRGEQQAVLTELQVPYRFVEPGDMDRVEAIATALT